MSSCYRVCAVPRLSVFAPSSQRGSNPQKPPAVTPGGRPRTIGPSMRKRVIHLPHRERHEGHGTGEIYFEPTQKQTGSEFLRRAIWRQRNGGYLFHFPG